MIYFYVEWNLSEMNIWLFYKSITNNILQIHEVLCLLRVVLNYFVKTFKNFCDHSHIAHIPFQQQQLTQLVHTRQAMYNK